MLAEAVIARCRKLASFSEDAGGTRRTFLSAAMHDCHREVSSWIENAWHECLGRCGWKICEDFILRFAGDATDPDWIASGHGANAGAFDGILGVCWQSRWWILWMGRKLPFESML